MEVDSDHLMRRVNYTRIAANIGAMADHFTRRYLLTLLSGECNLTHEKAKLVQAIVDHAADLPVHKAYDILRLLRDVSQYKPFYTRPRRYSQFRDTAFLQRIVMSYEAGND